MHILVIGPGAVGMTYGLLLEKAGHTVYFQSRKTPSVEKSLTIYFEERNQTETIPKPHIHPEPTQFFRSPALDLIIISLKTTENYLLENLLSKHTITPNTIILVVQNGIGNEETLAKLLPAQSTIAGVTDIAAFRESSHKVTVKRLGLLKLAPLNPNNTAACDAVEAALLQPYIPVNISKRTHHKQIRWEKLLWNIPFNSLSTLCRVPASHLLLNKRSEAFVRALMLEVIHIAANDGAHIPIESIETLFNATLKLGDYYPSMYTDFLNGRPIESEYILQNALTIAETQGVDTPILRFINTEIQKVPIPALALDMLDIYISTFTYGKGI